MFAVAAGAGIGAAVDAYDVVVAGTHVGRPSVGSRSSAEIVVAAVDDSAEQRLVGTGCVVACLKNQTWDPCRSCCAWRIGRRGVSCSSQLGGGIGLEMP